MRLYVFARCAAFALLMAAVSPLYAQALVIPPAPMSRDDLATVYTELMQTYDGFLYTVHLLGYPDEDSARKGWERLQGPPFRMQRLDRIFKNVTPRNVFLFQLDPALREKLVSLTAGQRTGPVLTARGWVLCEFVSKRVTPVPGFEQVQAGIPGFVAARVLPSASELLSTPALRARTVANQIWTTDALSAAPGDLDVNMKLSSENTLLMRAVSLGRFDLVEALLKRGANPNQCARGSCPLEGAIFGGSRAAVDLLLGAGADPNQRDPSIGVEEGPLGAAVAKGDVEIVTRLIASGAKVNAQGKGASPLMAAAETASRPMTELLIAKGADLFAVTDSAPARSALDVANHGKHAAYAAWLRGLMREKAKGSGNHAWDGWIEQDGRRVAIDGKPVTLKRAPFRIVVRARPGQMFYASASNDARLVEEIRKGDPDSAFFSTMTTSAENPTGDTSLVVHEPRKPGERWGGNHAWWAKSESEKRFSSFKDTPQGREHVREVNSLIVIDAADRINDEAPVSAYKGASLFLALGTRVHMTFMDDEVFGVRTVELKFQ